MKTLELIAKSEADGIFIETSGNGNLTMRGNLDNFQKWRELIKQNKTEILRLINPKSDGWSVRDWHLLFLNRVEFFNRGNNTVQQNETVSIAYSYCLSHWQDLNPSPSEPDRCAHCGSPHRVLLAYLTSRLINNPVHTWLHLECSTAWHDKRKEVAEQALKDMGISIPELD